MRRPWAIALAVAGIVLAGAVLPVAGQEPARPEGAIQPVSWDGWLMAKTKAEEHNAAGNFVAALQYYLEYARQAQGLGSPVRVAWGKNNAAFMLIKMHRQDPSVDLSPAKRLLEEGLGITQATEDCRRVMEMNLEHVKSCLRTRG